MAGRRGRRRRAQPLGRRVGCQRREQQRADAGAEAAQDGVEAAGAAAGARVEDLAAARVERDLGGDRAARAGRVVRVLCNRRARRQLHDARQRQQASLVLHGRDAHAVAQHRGLGRAPGGPGGRLGGREAWRRAVCGRQTVGDASPFPQGTS
jgi:hypothetical protein